ncbi:pyridoxamine 5'-phosphate oxidase family protein [Streptomyces sp. NBC_01341]|uniref:MSMEG_1061 family FMN-dependent PPOX-type flavoprotein n=1 Tax=Streptomyces sp. NBC_01341 TaxID=2903831 RepID=UPI002E1470FC|nr:pyridoxamine 5'-phosphate oxidase family protein [Streptomyces sp. NBC_01341]
MSNAVTEAAPVGNGGPLAGAVPLESAEQLREILGEPWPIVIEKVHDELTEADVDLLARSPFCAVSTSDADGNCDTSPRGGEAGFTRVLDARTLVMPDLPGNRRGDSFHNILVNPHVGLLYLIPGAMTVLRINGRARILTDAPVFDEMKVKGRRPDLALVVDIDEIYPHCPASLKRSGVWSPETWEERPARGAAAR